MPWVETLAVICYDKNTSHFETSEAPVVHKEAMGDVLRRERCTQTDEVRSEQTNILSWFMLPHQTALCHPKAQPHSHAIPCARMYAAAWNVTTDLHNCDWSVCGEDTSNLLKYQHGADWPEAERFFSFLTFVSLFHSQCIAFSMWLATTAPVGFPQTQKTID